MTKRIFRWVKKIYDPENKRNTTMPQDLWFAWGFPEKFVIEWEMGKDYAIIKPLREGE